MASLNNEAAVSSSSSSRPLSSTDHQNHYTYEVFLSFRGEDTRFNFTDHLYNALCRKGIETFRDDKLKRGEDISQELLKRIEESRVSIIVFSQNYASSRWCLDELVKIFECRKSKGQEVRAVFYKVTPSDVRQQTGAFGDAFSTLDQCKYEDCMDKWKAALKEAADLSGWPLKDGEYETTFIEDIVEELSAQVINPSCDLHVAEHPIGLESCRQDVNTLLKAEENIVRMVGIWGPGGIGKTTIAKDVFNSIRRKFEASCFLTDFRSKSLAQLQETLLSHILNSTSLKVSSVHQGVSFIKTKMQHKKVLLILDDVSHFSQLKNLVPSLDCFGPGSRILITARDEHLLTTHNVQSVYKVKMLNDAEAMELFSWNAFKCNGPPEDFMKLAKRAIRYAQGLPLALIVVGCHLCARRKEQWDDALDSYKRAPHKNIQDILKISFDALEEDSLKELFLDIACFFKGADVNHVIPIQVACDRNPVIGIEILKERALITMDGHMIMMHDLIEEMGREIVRQQGKPGKRSRLWNYDDVYHVLTDNTGTEEIKGIQVQRLNARPNAEICLNAESFSKMTNLIYFSSGNFLHYSGNIDRLSNELRWLDWSNCPIQSFPSNFYPRKLVALNISYSPHITRLWEGVKNCPFLTHMDLRGCESLTELPDFTRIPNLKELKLDGYGCENLTTLPCSIYELQNLEILNVSGCSNLVTFPKKASISHDDSGSLALPRLRILKINGCNLSTAEFIGSLDCLETLTELDLSRNNFVNVPALGKFVNLLRINLYCCKRLLEIPELSSNILELNARGCESLERFLILPKSLNMLEMNLWNCHRFSYSLGYDMEKMKNILLNNQNNSPLTLVLPGSEVPKWFHISKEVAANEKGLALTCAISFEIPSKLNWENIGLALCSVLVEETFSIFTDDRAVISINGEQIDQRSNRHSRTPIGHMRLNYIPLCDEIKEKVDQKGWSRYHCRVQFYPVDQMKSCGVHLVCQPPNEYSNKIVMAAEPADGNGMLDCLSSPSIEDDCESLDTDVGLDIRGWESPDTEALAFVC
ncbi:disease resistance protein RUN1 [Rosa sericea]